MEKRIPMLLACLAVLPIWVQPAAGQTTGSIRGKVVDAAGSELPGVTVSLAGELIRVDRSTVTSATGKFSFSAVPPGAVTVTGALDGFESESVEVRVSITEATSLNLVLRPSQRVEEALTVVSEAPLINPTSNAVGSNFSADFIEDLPTEGFFQEYMEIAPGISRSSEGGTRFSAFGSSTSSNSWNIDGLNATAGDTGNAWWYINPDTIAEVQVLGVGAPAEFGSMSGAAINVVTKSGTNDHKGKLNWSEQFDGLTDTNVEVDGPVGRTGHVRDVFRLLMLTAGGPIKQDKLWYFGALEYSQDALSEPGTDPSLIKPFEWWRYDLRVTASLNDSNTLDFKGHYEDYDWNDPGEVGTAPSATGVEFGHNPAWGLLWQSVLTNDTFLEVHYAGWTGDDFWRSQTDSTEVPLFDGTVSPAIVTGGVTYPFDYFLSRDQVDVKLSHYADEFLQGSHDFKFGVQYSRGDAKTEVVPAFGGFYLYKYDYYPGYPYYYKYEQLPHYYGSESETLSLFVDDSWRISDAVTLNLGVRYDADNSDIPAYNRLDIDGNPTGEVIPGVENVVEWETIAPRIGLTWQVGKQRRGVVRASYGKYFDGNVSGNWNWPPPDLPPFIYSYSYAPDGYFYTFSEFTSDNVALPDPNMKPPEADQIALGYEYQLGDDFALGVMGIFKETKNLIGWEILGDGVYDFVPFVDAATGRELQLASIVERPTVRKGNRPGVGSLAPPGARYEQEYEGIVLSLNKRYSNGWSLRSSYTYSESTGRIPRPLQQTQHTPFYGSLEGSDPNAHLNGDQLLQGDRKHVVQIQSNFALPWQLDGSASFSFLGGRPYSRQGRTSLAQGGTTFIVEPANDSLRLPDQTILDVGLGRDFQLGSGVGARIDVQIINLLNEDANDFWQDADYRRGVLVPSDWVFPRRVQIRFQLNWGS